MAENPACALLDAFGVTNTGRYEGRTRIGWVPIGSSVNLANSAIEYVDGVAVIPGSTFAWFQDPLSRTLVIVQEQDPNDGNTLKNAVYIDWSIDLSLVANQQAVFQVGHDLNGLHITHCIYMPDAEITTLIAMGIIDGGGENLIYVPWDPNYVLPFSINVGTSPPGAFETGSMGGGGDARGVHAYIDDNGDPVFLVGLHNGTIKKCVADTVGGSFTVTDFLVGAGSSPGIQSIWLDEDAGYAFYTDYTTMDVYRTTLGNPSADKTKIVDQGSAFPRRITGDKVNQRLYGSIGTTLFRWSYAGVQSGTLVNPFGGDEPRPLYDPVSKKVFLGHNDSFGWCDADLTNFEAWYTNDAGKPGILTPGFVSGGYVYAWASGAEELWRIPSDKSTLVWEKVATSVGVGTQDPCEICEVLQ